MHAYTSSRKPTTHKLTPLHTLTHHTYTTHTHARIIMHAHTHKHTDAHVIMHTYTHTPLHTCQTELTAGTEEVVTAPVLLGLDSSPSPLSRIAQLPASCCCTRG